MASTGKGSFMSDKTTGSRSPKKDIDEYYRIKSVPQETTDSSHEAREKNIMEFTTAWGRGRNSSRPALGFRTSRFAGNQEQADDSYVSFPEPAADETAASMPKPGLRIPSNLSNSRDLSGQIDVTQLVATINRLNAASGSHKSSSRFSSNSSAPHSVPKHDPVHETKIDDTEAAIYESLMMVKNQLNEMQMDNQKSHLQTVQQSITQASKLQDLRGHMADLRQRHQHSRSGSQASGSGNSSPGSGNAREGSPSQIFLEQWESEKQALQDALRTVTEGADRHARVSEVAITGLASEKNHLAAQLTHTQSEMASLKSAVAKIKDHCLTLKDENSNYQVVQDHLVAQNDGLRADFKALKKENKNLRQEEAKMHDQAAQAAISCSEGLRVLHLFTHTLRELQSHVAENALEYKMRTGALEGRVKAAELERSQSRGRQAKGGEAREEAPQLAHHHRVLAIEAGDNGDHAPEANPNGRTTSAATHSEGLHAAADIGEEGQHVPEAEDSPRAVSTDAIDDDAFKKMSTYSSVWDLDDPVQSIRVDTMTYLNRMKLQAMAVEAHLAEAVNTSGVEPPKSRATSGVEPPKPRTSSGVEVPKSRAPSGIELPKKRAPSESPKKLAPVFAGRKPKPKPLTPAVDERCVARLKKTVTQNRVNRIAPPTRSVSHLLAHGIFAIPSESHARQPLVDIDRDTSLSIHPEGDNERKDSWFSENPLPCDSENLIDFSSANLINFSYADRKRTASLPVPAPQEDGTKKLVDSAKAETNRTVSKPRTVSEKLMDLSYVDPKQLGGRSVPVPREDATENLTGFSFVHPNDVEGLRSVLEDDQAAGRISTSSRQASGKEKPAQQSLPRKSSMKEATNAADGIVSGNPIDFNKVSKTVRVQSPHTSDDSHMPTEQIMTTADDKDTVLIHEVEPSADGDSEFQMSAYEAEHSSEYHSQFPSGSAQTTGERLSRDQSDALAGRQGKGPFESSRSGHQGQALSGSAPSGHQGSALPSSAPSHHQCNDRSEYALSDYQGKDLSEYPSEYLHESEGEAEPSEPTFHTLRPSMPPRIALRAVIEELEAEVTDLKSKLVNEQWIYNEVHPGAEKHKRIETKAIMDGLTKMIEHRSDQVYALYDVVEGMKVNAARFWAGETDGKEPSGAGKEDTEEPSEVWEEEVAEE